MYYSVSISSFLLRRRPSSVYWVKGHTTSGFLESLCDLGDDDNDEGHDDLSTILLKDFLHVFFPSCLSQVLRAEESGS